MTTLDISLNKRYLRQSAESCERYAVGAFPTEQFGRNWSGPAVADTNYEGLQAIENAEEYSVGTGDSPWGGGEGWSANPVTGTNFTGLKAIETCEEYSVGTGDSPYAGGSGWSANPVTGTNA